MPYSPTHSLAHVDSVGMELYMRHEGFDANDLLSLQAFVEGVTVSPSRRIAVPRERCNTPSWMSADALDFWNALAVS